MLQYMDVRIKVTFNLTIRVKLLSRCLAENWSAAGHFLFWPITQVLSINELKGMTFYNAQCKVNSTQCEESEDNCMWVIHIFHNCLMRSQNIWPLLVKLHASILYISLYFAHKITQRSIVFEA